jgi:glutamate-1-semialdehyde 2,1-aminomutase/spore coat polysaccharide biosynthesis protein SpsF
MAGTSYPDRLSLHESERLWQRARRAIPGGTQTLSKAPSQFVDGVSPKFLHHGKGAHVWDVDGNEYIDYPMALGPILLGYDHPAVTAAAVAQIREGTVFTLAHPREVELAERLIDVIPCAERVRFAKNGADATNGAVRAARALTGREHVICTGYHGYHDWYIASTERRDGVPASQRELVHPVPFGDLPALEETFDRLADRVAALVIEIPAEDPEPGYLTAVADLARSRGAVFVLDEIVTGFRYALGGAQALYGIEPDIACFGKGMANGFPIAAVVGSAEAMEPFERIFFSMTYGGETVAMAAALATLDVLTTEPVVEHIWKIGAELRDGIQTLTDQVSFGVEINGNPPRSSLTFTTDDGRTDADLRGIFLQETHRRGVLFGVPIFPTYSHTKTDVRATLSAVEAAFERMEDAHASGDYGAHLDGPAPGGVFRSHT